MTQHILVNAPLKGYKLNSSKYANMQQNMQHKTTILLNGSWGWRLWFGHFHKTDQKSLINTCLNDVSIVKQKQMLLTKLTHPAKFLQLLVLQISHDLWHVFLSETTPWWEGGYV